MSDNFPPFFCRPAEAANTASLALKLTNPIEKWAGFLREVGDPIIEQALYVEAQVAALARARARVTQCEQELAAGRDALLQRIRQHYVDSEIETADVMCTRSLFSSPDGGEGV